MSQFEFPPLSLASPDCISSLIESAMLPSYRQYLDQRQAAIEIAIFPRTVLLETFERLKKGFCDLEDSFRAFIAQKDRFMELVGKETQGIWALVPPICNRNIKTDDLFSSLKTPETTPILHANWESMKILDNTHSKILEALQDVTQSVLDFHALFGESKLWKDFHRQAILGLEVNNLTEFLEALKTFSELSTALYNDHNPNTKLFVPYISHFIGYRLLEDPFKLMNPIRDFLGTRGFFNDSIDAAKIAIYEETKSFKVWQYSKLFGRSEDQDKFRKLLQKLKAPPSIFQRFQNKNAYWFTLSLEERCLVIDAYVKHQELKELRQKNQHHAWYGNFLDYDVITAINRVRGAEKDKLEGSIKNYQGEISVPDLACKLEKQRELTWRTACINGRSSTTVR